MTTYVPTPQDGHEEFQMLFKEIPVNCPSDQYIEVDNNLATSEGVDLGAVDWRERHYDKRVLKK